METTIREYLREMPRVENSAGDPMGVMTATLKNGKLAFGWSQTHPRDTFHKTLGNLIATNRMNKFDPEVEECIIVPAEMCEAMERFIERAERYFRTKSNVRVLNGFELSTNYQRH